MDEFKINAAGPGHRCWCGLEAVIARRGDGIESFYCGDHWLVWWESALLAGAIIHLSA